MTEGDAAGQRQDRDPVEFEVLGGAGGYSREDAVRILSGQPPGPVPVKSAGQVSAELRAAIVPSHPAQRERTGQLSRARTEDEARVYLETRPCPRCGTEYDTWDRLSVEVDGELADQYTGECPVCGERNVIVLRLPDPVSPPPSADRISFGGPEPSELLDPGEWLWLADLVASGVPADDPAEAELALSTAVAAMEEVLKFVPSGTTVVPQEAFWSARGRQVRDREPGRFSRDRLVVVRDSYLRQLRQRGVLAVPTVAAVPVSHEWKVARGPLMAEANELLAAVHEAGRTGHWDRVERYGERLDVLRQEYTTLVPFRYLARCPYTGALVRWPIDDVDLDGWYWWYDAPARQLPRVPPTWLAMTGALRLGQPVAAAPFVCRPGPGAPFVVPALLRDGQATAVISEVPVGQHTGWAITYFGTAPAAAAKQVNLWGTGWSPVPDGAGGWVEQAAPAADGVERDFDLEPWLATGRLLWIAPGDQSLEPRKGVADCPYLDLEGPRESPTIRDGVVSYPDA